MAYLVPTTRYVPHDDVTRAVYERLLLDIRRCLPPGVEDDVQDIAEEVLAIVCTGATGQQDVRQQQAQLEQLFDTRLTREMRDQLLQYGKKITDYVSAAPAPSAEAQGGLAAGAAAVMDLDVAAPRSPSSGSNSSAAEEDAEAAQVALLTGRAPPKRKLRADKTLAPFAFGGAAVAEEALGFAGVESAQRGLRRGTDQGGDGEEADDGHVFAADVAMTAAAGARNGGGGAEEEEDDDDDGTMDNVRLAGNAELGEDEVGRAAPPIAFNTVACNAQYLKDSLRRLFPAQSIELCESQARRVLDFLSERGVDRFILETQLTAFLGGYDDEAVTDWIAEVCGSRWEVVYGARYAQCHGQKEREQVMDAMRSHAREDAAVARLYEGLTGKEVDLGVGSGRGRNNNNSNSNEEGDEEGRQSSTAAPLRRVDLQACAFQDERSPHQHRRATVPPGTQRALYDTHDEVILPPTPAYHGHEALRPIAEAFPAWARPAFGAVTHLNPMQSRVYECAFTTDENMLVSAPTGAGKTNVAAMAMLRAIENAMTTANKTKGAAATTNAIDLRGLKMVYVAPMKALVQEVVRTFTARLAPLGLSVAELSGDAAMTQRQMAQVQLIVTTPEKWDIVTRKSVDLGVAAMIKLLIIDEVHLLHNERGPVLEAIVARTLLQQQLRGMGGIRLVGLSATLPNVDDVASFLQVDRQRALFVFDAAYRPVPLVQTYCAVKKVKGMTTAAVMNRVTYDKALQAVMNAEQVMVFVHSRKETEYTAQFIRQRIADEHRTHNLVRPGSESARVLQDAVAGAATEQPLRRALVQLLPSGCAIHHAGLARHERQLVEALFAAGHIRVLVCTATLAWGVNLPANSVIIKGTRVFNGAKGTTELLSVLDVLQMFGRAGRLGFGPAALGRATIITSPDDLHYYLAVLNEQLPIESQLMRRVVDMLNAEVTLGHVESVDEGVQWLRRSYLYVRMRKVPELYGTRANPRHDPLLLQHLANIVHTACEELRAARMVEYDAHSRRVSPTAYGRIAAFCYITVQSMSAYLTHLTAAMQDVELFRVFALSSEFAGLSVRAEEQAQMHDLLAAAPIAVKESRHTPQAKANILLQCYISRKSLEGMPLMSELVYIKDSAQRILRALYEICLVREYGRTARQVLALYAQVLQRQWSVQSPTRQVRAAVSAKVFDSVLPTLERLRLPWEQVRSLAFEDLVERLGDDRRARAALDCIQRVPHYLLEVAVRPLTRNMLYVDVDLTADFVFDPAVHDRTAAELLLLIEEGTGRLIHYEPVQLPLAAVRQRQTVSWPAVVIPMVMPKPTHLYIRCVAPAWLGCSAVATPCLLNTLLPPLAPALREVHTTTSSANDEEARDVRECMSRYGLADAADRLFPFTSFTRLQSEVLPAIMEATTESVFAGVPPGAGKTTLAELFVLQFLAQQASKDGEGNEENKNTATSKDDDEPAKLIYLTAHHDVVSRRYLDWHYNFGEQLRQRVGRLETGMSLSQQRRVLAAHNIVLTTGKALLGLVRHGEAAALRAITHIIVDHAHLLRGEEGREVEECVARLNTAPFLVHHGTGRARLLVLSYPLISCAELARWLRISPARQYNFGLTYRTTHVRLEAMPAPSARGRYEMSVVAALKLLQRPSYRLRTALLFVPSPHEAELVARRAMLRCRAGFVPEQPLEQVENARLALYLAAGVGYVHRTVSALDLLTMLEQAGEPPRIRPDTQETLPLILVASYEAAWRLPAGLFATVLICAGEKLTFAGHSGEEEEKEATSTTSEEDNIATTANSSNMNIDCSVSELLQMSSRAVHEAVVYCRLPRRWVWSRMLGDPLPLESSLRYPDDFRDAVNAAVAQGRVQTRADVLRLLQTHYFLYHLKTHLHFYGVPAAEDIPLYASDLAARIVAALRTLGCVTVHGDAAEAQADHSTRNNHEEQEEEEEEEDDDDPMARLQPTTRGLAMMQYGVDMRSLDRVRQALRHGHNSAGTTITTTTHRVRLTSVAALWRMLAESCVELSASALGEAATEMGEAAEQRALHTIARALPASFGVSYVDMDFHAPSAKLYILVLAYCARFFRDAPPRTAEDTTHNHHNITTSTTTNDEGAESVLGDHHPFAYADLPATQRALLCSEIPQAIALRLAEDLYTILLPAARRVVRAMVEVIAGAPTLAELQHNNHNNSNNNNNTNTNGKGAMPAVSLMRVVRSFMHLCQALHRRVWVSENSLAQLPSVQNASPLIIMPANDASNGRESSTATTEDWLALLTPTYSLATLAEPSAQTLVALRAMLQQRVAAHTPESTMSAAVQSLLADPSDHTTTNPTQDTAAGEQTAALLCASLVREARAVARVTGLRASAGIAREAAVPSVSISVEADVHWQPSHARGEETEEEEQGEKEEERVSEASWWVFCYTQQKAERVPIGAAPTARLLALRAVSALPKAHTHAAEDPDTKQEEVKADASTSYEYTIQGELVVPVALLEQEADVAAIEVMAAVASVAYRVDSETQVAFA